MSTPFDDKLNEECGVFGVINHQDAATLTVLGLHALQHRGQEAAGIVTCDGEEFYKHLAFGKVGDKFNKPEIISRLKGNQAIGHNRYSTSGDKGANNIQPLYAECSYGHIALAHNGNLTNADSLAKKLISSGSIFSTSMDSEVLVHLISTSKKDTLKEAFTDALQQVKGGFSVVMMDKGRIIAGRDAHGIRPLSVGKLDDAWIVASESCAFDIIGAEFVRDVKAGEVVEITADGVVSSEFPLADKPSRFCVFEYVYFSRPDSFIEGKDVYQVRKNMGRELAKEANIDVDVVIPVPDSGISAALGYGAQAKIPFELGIIRNHYVGRTFIEPTDSIRHLGVKLKLNPNSEVIRGKKVVLVDDSIVRGTTSKKIIEMVRKAGAKEVHMCISSPATNNPCFYGVDTPSKDKLLAARMNNDEMAKFIGADSLTFISKDGLYRAVSGEARNNKSPQYCDACFTGEYPVEVGDAVAKTC